MTTRNVKKRKKNRGFDNVEVNVRKRFSNKMSKYLGVVDPSNGDKWFEMAASKTKKEKGLRLNLEKLHHLSISKLNNDLKCKILGYCVSNKEIWDLAWGHSRCKIKFHLVASLSVCVAMCLDNRRQKFLDMDWEGSFFMRC